MSLKRYVHIGALLLAITALLTACGQSATAEKPGVSTAVVGREMSFTPALVTATVGKPITIAFTNEGVIEHDWAVLNLPAHDVRATEAEDGHSHAAQPVSNASPTVHVAALPGKQSDVTFTPERPGRYTIVCTVPGHKEAGMMGILTVVE
ncbi:MAG TPA: plastocyanin/azurin family copper-binding protein [Herpetosiphonaceae bacterium]